MSKDKRVKGCPNPECEKHRETFKFKSADSFCTSCASELAFVCSKCFSKIEDTGSDHRVCKACEAKAADRKDSVGDIAKKIGGAVLGIAGTAAVIAKKAAPVIKTLIKR